MAACALTSLNGQIAPNGLRSIAACVHSLSFPKSQPPRPGILTLVSQATVEDLDPPPALSTSPHSPISAALLRAFERDYSHLTVVSDSTRSLLGYLNIPRLKALLKEGAVKEEDWVEKAMQKFARKGRVYKVITMDTPLEELEAFFEGGNDFAVVTDANRRFVLGVATRGDLEDFVRRRPA